MYRFVARMIEDDWYAILRRGEISFFPTVVEKSIVLDLTNVDELITRQIISRSNLLSSF